MKRLFRLEQSGVIYRFFFFSGTSVASSEGLSVKSIRIWRQTLGFKAYHPRWAAPMKGDDGLQDCAHRKKRTFW